MFGYNKTLKKWWLAVLGIMCVIVRNCEILKVGAVKFAFQRSLEFCGKTIGYHIKHLSIVWMFSNFFIRCLLGVRAGV